MKKSLIICLSILSIAFIASISTSNANMFNRFKKGFYFEKYKTAEEAKAELLKLHPIGSDVESLVKRLEAAGGSLVNTVRRKDVSSDFAKEREYFYKGVSELAIEKQHYEYKSGIQIINPLLWKIMIFYDENKKITDLYLGRHYMGL